MDITTTILGGHVPFELTEAVILLEVYLWAKCENLSDSIAAKTASELLRCYATRQGFQFDDSYRSVSGIMNRLRSIGFCYERMGSVKSSTTQVFREVVTMRRDKRSEYDAILSQILGVLPVNYWEEVGITMETTSLTDSFEDNLNLVENAIQEYYPTGFRFDETVLQLLEIRTGVHFEKELIEILKRKMFGRKDGLFFFPASLWNIDQKRMLNKDQLVCYNVKFPKIIVRNSP